MTFLAQLQVAWSGQQSMLTVGLDPDPARFPTNMRDRPEAILDFCRGIVDATASHAVAFKPQIAYFAAQGAEPALEALCTYIREQYPQCLLVLDAKRGDIGATATQYACEAFERYGAHAVTVNPYMGHDSIEPYLRWHDRGIFVLCRTSNPGGSDLQFLNTNGEPLYLKVAEMAAGVWSQQAAPGQIGLVVGATYPAELAQVRARVGDDMPLLVPGIGAQGGDIAASVKAGRNSQGYGMLINSSRAILYASSGNDWQEAAAREAALTRAAIERERLV